MRWPALFVVVLCLLGSGSRAVAGEAPSAVDLQRARAHFEAGSGLYQLGRYDEAIREFSAGYALSHRPLFALNIAQCYRMLGRYQDARDMIRRYLADAPPDAPERASATSLLAETEAKLREQPAPAEPATMPAASAAPTGVAPTTASPTNATSSPALVATPPAPPRHSHRGAYIALGVTGAVLVVGAAVVLGVVLGAPSDTVPSTPLGTVRFGR